jgi:N-dimethylarginine dimethylaminohydrolase
MGDQTSTLTRVMVHAPSADDLKHWEAYGWRSEPDARVASEEHEAFRTILADFGAEIVLAPDGPTGDPDAVYAYDPVLIAEAGAILLRPGKEGRRGEPALMAEGLIAAGVPLVDRIDEPGTAEGGDMFWLDAHTLLIGRGYRTNDEGIRQLRSTLGGSADVVAFDLPHLNGPTECLHLMSFISPLAPDLAVVYMPLMPVRLVELLLQRGVELIEVPQEEFGSMGPNVLALAPRVALALDGNPRTRARMEAAGVEVRVYKGEEISRKGDGGPTCLTRPLARG